MGGCGSTHHLAGKTHNRPKQAPPAMSEVVRVIYEDGRLGEFKPSVTAETVVRKVGGYLCSWESMYVNVCTPEMAPEEELKAGQLYFVMPKAMAKQPLSLQQMCELAVKASSRLSLHDFQSSFRR